MNWFKDNQDEWKSIIEIMSSETKKTVLMIEKVSNFIFKMIPF